MADISKSHAAGSTATASNGRQQKLKDTCDMCSASKVRCDKRKPLCSRCERLGYPCFYSPARRIRKKPCIQTSTFKPEIRPEISRNRSQTSISIHSGHSNQSQDEVSDSRPATSISAYLEDDDVFDFSRTPDEDERPNRLIAEGHHFGPPPESDYSPDTVDVDMLDVVHSHPIVPSTFSNTGEHTPDDHSLSLSHDSNINLSNYHVSVGDDVPDFDCATVAMSILHQLNTTVMERPTSSRSNMSHEPTTPPSASSEDCLRTISSAVKRVSTILICPCSSRTDIGLLAATVCVALLDALEHVLRAVNTSSSTGSSPSANSTGAKPARPTYQRSISQLMRSTEALEMCARKLRDGISAKATIMLVLEQLPRVANLATQFTQRYKADPTPSARELLQELAASITGRLKVLVDEVTDLVAQVG